MSVDTSIIVAVIGNQLLQLHRCLRQRLDGEGHILDETRGADRTRTTYTWEDTRADSPILAVDLRILGKLGRDIEFELSQTLLDLLNLLKQLLVRDALGLREDCRQIVIVARLHTRNLTCIHIFLVLQEDGIIHRVERHIVEHLGTLHDEILGTHLQVFFAGLHLLHGYHCLATLLHRVEIEHGRSFERIVIKRLHRYFREEGECTLRAYHRVGDDVKRIIVGDERTKVQSRHVLNTIFGTYARGQRFISSYLVAQGFNLLDKLRMTLAEGLLALFVTRIENSTIRQNDTCRHHHTVAVGMHTAVHTRGVVDDDTAHHR